MPSFYKTYRPIGNKVISREKVQDKAYRIVKNLAATKEHLGQGHVMRVLCAILSSCKTQQLLSHEESQETLA